MIYVSTGGFDMCTFLDTALNLVDAGIFNIELSGGKPTHNIEQDLIKLSQKVNLKLHNYFPPPLQPFVFNLASLDETIYEASVMHAKNAIDLSSIVGSSCYSFHAGYLVDPKVGELGKKISIRKISDRGFAIKLFIERVNALADYASSKGVMLLIENNVLSAENYASFGCNPLIMADYEETVEVIEKTTSNVGLLIDVAHLKVSSQTLNYNAGTYLRDFKESTFAYHFSDNLGFADTNDPVDEKSWFWDLIRLDLDYYSLEVYGATPKQLFQQVKLVEKFIN